MEQALYRKYRPKSLDDIYGQEPIIYTLKQALKQNQISHAYLFTGPRGVGKTSVARILAHEVNGLAYNDQSTHIDIIEIDAASNRRIDEIRELRDKVYVAPAQAKYKVYIIDEVHMLTKEAFNALLKTLEEPPAHVIFILATTDAHKLPETIISRTQRYSFKPITLDETIAYLKEIAKAEKININDAALKLLAEHGDGSMRDSTGLLDQARHFAGKIDAVVVSDMLGLPPKESVKALADATLLSSSPKLVMSTLNDLFNQGFQASTIAKQLSEMVRQDILSGKGNFNSEQALELLKLLIQVPASFDPKQYLEITLLKASPTQKAQPQPTIEIQAEVITAPKPIENTAVDILPEEPNPEPQAPKKSQSQNPKPSPKTKMPFDDKLWAESLLAIKKQHNTLYSIARMAEPRFEDDNTLVLAFAFDFHKKRISEAAYNKLLSDIVSNLAGVSVSIKCIVDKNATPLTTVSEKTEVASETGDITAISNIFEGAEVLES